MTQSPEACRTMAEIRAAIDALDRDLVALIARRYRYIAAAARVKTERAAVRDEPRKAAVIANAVAAARASGAPDDSIAAIWELLVEDSIARELGWFDTRPD